MSIIIDVGFTWARELIDLAASSLLYQTDDSTQARPANSCYYGHRVLRR